MCVYNTCIYIVHVHVYTCIVMIVVCLLNGFKNLFRYICFIECVCIPEICSNSCVWNAISSALYMGSDICCWSCISSCYSTNIHVCWVCSTLEWKILFSL